jgi:hypothetical protein
MAVSSYERKALLSFPQLSIGRNTSDSKWGELIRVAKSNDDKLNSGLNFLASVLPTTVSGEVLVSSGATATIDFADVSNGFILISSAYDTDYSGIFSYTTGEIATVWKGVKIVTALTTTSSVYIVPSSSGVNGINIYNGNTTMTFSYLLIK